MNHVSLVGNDGIKTQSTDSRTQQLLCDGFHGQSKEPSLIISFFRRLQEEHGNPKTPAVNRNNRRRKNTVNQ